MQYLTDDNRVKIDRMFELAERNAVGVSGASFPEEGYTLIGELGSEFYPRVRGTVEYQEIKDALGDDVSVEDVFLAFVGTLSEGVPEDASRADMDFLAEIFFSYMYELAYLK